MDKKPLPSDGDMIVELTWRKDFFRWSFPVVLAIIGEHLARTWNAVTVPIDIAAILVVASAWIGVMLRPDPVARYAGYFVDIAILTALSGGVGTIAVFSSQAGFEVLRELAFWAPVISVFWVTVHHRQPKLAVAFIAVLYCGIFWGYWSSHALHDAGTFARWVFEYLAQAALLIALMKLFWAFKQREMVLKEKLDMAVNHALHDTLTSLPNRRSFDEELLRGCERVNRDGSRLSIIVADIDHFKAFNDEYGHSCGDEVLKTVARIISERIRVSDWACRWGGEEFAIILHNTDLANARDLAEELRVAFAAHLIRDKKQLTVSLGVSEYRPGETPHAVFDRADMAMFRAKSLGRNRVETDCTYPLPSFAGE